MSAAFQIAVITLAVFFGILATLGAIVLVKIFIGAYQLKAQLGNVPAQLAARQNALNQMQQQIVAGQKKLATDRAALAALTIEASKTIPAVGVKIEEVVKTQVAQAEAEANSIVEQAKAETAKIKAAIVEEVKKL